MLGAITGESRSNLAAATPARPRIRDRLVLLLRLWALRAETRADLEGLPPERLRDLGLTDCQARREAALPFWR